MEHGIWITVNKTDEVYHLTYDRGIMLTAYDVSSPVPQTYTTEINGRDGTLDFSDMFGEIRFKNRTITASFNIDKIGNQTKQMEFYNDLLMKIHGQKVKVTHWQRTDVYFLGRCTVGDFDKKSSTFALTVDAEPYAYYFKPCQVHINATSAGVTTTIYNRGKEVVPHISVNGNVNVKIDDSIYSFSTGEYDALNIALKKSSTTTVVVSGTGNVEFTYRERVL